MNVFVGCFDVLSDVYMFLLPLPVLWNLQMPYRRKVGTFGHLLHRSDVRSSDARGNFSRSKVQSSHRQFDQSLLSRSSGVESQRNHVGYSPSKLFSVRGFRSPFFFRKHLLAFC